MEKKINKRQTDRQRQKERERERDANPFIKPEWKSKASSSHTFLPSILWLYTRERPPIVPTEGEPMYGCLPVPSFFSRSFPSPFNTYFYMSKARRRICGGGRGSRGRRVRSHNGGGKIYGYGPGTSLSSISSPRISSRLPFHSPPFSTVPLFCLRMRCM